MTHLLFRNVLSNLQIFGDFPSIFLVLVSSLIPMWSENSSVQSLSHVRLFVTPWTAACQASLSINNSRSPLKPMSIESVIYHPTISSSVVPFSCPQSFPGSGVFQMSQLFASGGQSIGASASAIVLPMNIQD